MGAETWIAIGKFIASVFGFASAGTGWYFFAVQVVRVALVAIAAKSFTPKLDLSAAAREKLLTTRDPIFPQTIIYGEDMISGPLFLANTQGTDNDELWLGVILTGHEIDSIVKYRLDDDDILLGQLTGAFDGDVNAGKYNGVASVFTELGTSTQAVRAEISTAFGSLWVAAHTGQGWSYMMWKFLIVQDNTAFETGAPQNLKALIRGRKLYDPRLDSTNGGTGPQRFTDPTTWTWSDNPALALSDWLRDDKFGMQELDSRMDWPLVIAAADICDQTLTVPAPVSSQKRYTINATFRANMRRGEVRDVLLTAMLGRMVFSQGKWKMWAGAAITPNVTLTEANLSGGIQLQATQGAKERYNRVRGKFVDPSRNYQAQAYPEQRSALFEAEDGGEVRPLTADFVGANQEFEAQRDAIITLKQSRNQRIISFQGNLSCFRIQPGTTVLLTIAEYGFSGEKFFVTEWQMNEQGILLTMIEEVDTAWADPLVGDYTTRTETGVLIFANSLMKPPTGLTALSLIDGVLLQWTNPPQTMFDHVEIHASDSDVRSTATIIGTSSGVTFVEVIKDRYRNRYYWIRAVNEFGTVSLFEPDTTTTTAIAAPLIASDSFLRDPDFDLSTALATPATALDHFWHQEVIVTDGGVPGTATAVTLEIGAGRNGSNTVKMVHGNEPNITPPPFVRKRLRFTVSKRFRANIADFTVKIIWRNNSALPYKQLSIGIIGYAAETGGAALTFDGILSDFAVTGTTWQELTFHAKPAAVPDGAQFWEVKLQSDDTDNLDIFEFEIDSIFAYAGEAAFGTNTVAGKTQQGTVPEADQATEATKVLQGDGQWVTNAGAVDSFNGRVGAVVPLIGDYDSFFLTPAEGDAVYSLLGHSHVPADITFAATNRFLGRDTAGGGAGEELTAAAARTILNVENASTADQSAAEIEAIVSHDNLQGVAAAEHVDWAITGSADIHADRFLNSSELRVVGGGAVKLDAITTALARLHGNIVGSTPPVLADVGTNLIGLYNSAAILWGQIGITGGNFIIQSSVRSGRMDFQVVNSSGAATKFIQALPDTTAVTARFNWTFNGFLNMQDNTLRRALIDDFAVAHQVKTGVASTTINYVSGQSVLLNLAAANITTLTITNWPATGRLGQLEIEVKQGATPRTIAWDTAIAGTVEWDGGTEPNLNVANGRFLVHLRSRDNKTTLVGTFTGALS